MFSATIGSKATVKVAKVANERLCVPAFVLYLFVLGPADLVRSASALCVGDSAWEGMQRLILLASSSSSKPPGLQQLSLHRVRHGTVGRALGARRSVGLSEIQMVGVNSATLPEIKSCSRYFVPINSKGRRTSVFATSNAKTPKPNDIDRYRYGTRDVRIRPRPLFFFLGSASYLSHRGRSIERYNTS